MHRTHLPTPLSLIALLLLTACAKPPPPPTSLEGTPTTRATSDATQAATLGATTSIGTQPPRSLPPPPRWERGPGGGFSAAQSTKTIPPPSPPLPDATTTTPGVVAILWTTTTTTNENISPARLAERFAQELSDNPIPATTRDLWLSNGIALTLIPRARVRDLQAACAMAGPAQQQQFNFAATRMELTRGETSGPTDALALDSGLVPLRYETARLLLRAWPTPPPPSAEGAAANTTPGVTLELTPELITANPTKARGLPEDSAVTIAQPAGTLLSRLAVELPFADATTALVLTLPPPAISSTTTDNGLDPTGPAPPTLPTLGDALLADPFSFPPPATQRLLIILPTPPATFRLLR